MSVSKAWIYLIVVGKASLYGFTCSTLSLKYGTVAHSAYIAMILIYGTYGTYDVMNYLHYTGEANL